MSENYRRLRTHKLIAMNKQWKYIAYFVSFTYVYHFNRVTMWLIVRMKKKHCLLQNSFVLNIENTFVFFLLRLFCMCVNLVISAMNAYIVANFTKYSNIGTFCGVSTQLNTHLAQCDMKITSNITHKELTKN